MTKTEMVEFRTVGPSEFFAMPGESSSGLVWVRLSGPMARFCGLKPESARQMVAPVLVSPEKAGNWATETLADENLVARYPQDEHLRTELPRELVTVTPVMHALASAFEGDIRSNAHSDRAAYSRSHHRRILYDVGLPAVEVIRQYLLNNKPALQRVRDAWYTLLMDIAGDVARQGLADTAHAIRGWATDVRRGHL